MYESAQITHDISASSLETLLENMPNVGDVDVSRTPVASSTGTHDWIITFVGHVDDVPN